MSDTHKLNNKSTLFSAVLQMNEIFEVICSIIHSFNIYQITPSVGVPGTEKKGAVIPLDLNHCMQLSLTEQSPKLS